MAFYSEKMFFIFALIVLLIVFIINIFSNNSGTYVDHTADMWNLFKKKFKNVEPSKPRQPFESKGESECRRAAESLTGKPFPKERPMFMKNSVSGQNLELDCYCDELKIAIEYNGEQHYKYIPYFHHNKDAYYNMKYRDEMKKKLCEENGVKLIVVPYTVPFNKIDAFISDELKKYQL
jgi:hypothetical protein